MDQLEVVAYGASGQGLARLARMLARATRPDFPDRVAGADRACHAAVRDLAFPDEIEVAQNILRVSWSDSDVTLDEVREAFARLDVLLVAAFVFPDSSRDFEDEGDVEGCYLLNQDGKLRRVTEKSLARLFPGKQIPGLADEDNTSRTLLELATLVLS